MTELNVDFELERYQSKINKDMDRQTLEIFFLSLMKLKFTQQV